MHFLIDSELKLIFGFSAKCACTTIKKIFLENTTDKCLKKLYKGNMVHFPETYNGLPKQIYNYKIFLFIRNPYKRIISGIFNKYTQGGQYAERWTQGVENLNFKQFVDTILDEGIGKQIDWHHFTPQTTEKWEDRLLDHHNLVVMDIENIDYNVLNDVFKTNIITSTIRNKNKYILTEKRIVDDAWGVQIDKLAQMSIDYKSLYNNELKRKVYKIYEKDFKTFEKLGFNYDI